MDETERLLEIIDLKINNLLDANSDVDYEADAEDF